MGITIAALSIAGTACLALSVIWNTLRHTSPPLPSHPKTREALCFFIEDNPRRIIDLGSGWGGLLFFCGEKFPEAQRVGYEISPVPAWFSAGVSTVFRKECHIIHSCFSNLSIEEGDYLLAYLCPESMEMLEAHLREETKTFYLISHTFALPHTPYTDKTTADDMYSSPVYLYVFPTATKR
ncbi:MAG: hypothetical protein ACQEQ4_07925 [Fibrobacterota bacterium]